MRKCTTLVVLGFTLFYLPISLADYNANIQGVVIDVVVYTGGDHIYIRLHIQPASHPECRTDYFAVDGSTPPDRLGRILSRLLTAYATGEEVTIGYDDTGDCAKSRIRVHRVG